MLNEKALEAADAAHLREVKASPYIRDNIPTIIQAYLDALPPQEVTDEMVERAARAMWLEDQDEVLFDEAKVANDRQYIWVMQSVRVALQAALNHSPNTDERGK